MTTPQSHAQVSLFLKYLPWLFPKKDGAELEKAKLEVAKVYGTQAQYQRILHLTVHPLPTNGRVPRIMLLVFLALLWCFYYPLAVRLRSLGAAIMYSFTEFAFTFFERGQPYTSLAQFWTVLLYGPVVIDVYRDLFLPHSSAAYVLLFPLNIWLLEVVVGHLIILIYGWNCAWCYSDYSDAYISNCVRLNMAVFWVGMGAVGLLLSSMGMLGGDF